MSETITIKRASNAISYYFVRRETMQNTNLTFEARGMLAYILSDPDDWETSIFKQNSGRDKVRRILNELIKAGYLDKREPIRDPATKQIVAYTPYKVYEFVETDNDAKPNKKPASSKGFIYLIQGADSLYKIGKSKEPKKRISRLEVKLPFDIQVEHLIPSNSYHEAEIHLHERYAHRRIRGEWFDLSTSEVNEIKEIQRLDKQDMQ